MAVRQLKTAGKESVLSVTEVAVGYEARAEGDKRTIWRASKQVIFPADFARSMLICGSSGADEVAREAEVKASGAEQKMLKNENENEGEQMPDYACETLKEFATDCDWHPWSDLLAL